jgi:TM2 domain-containing membrane protein YozV
MTKKSMILAAILNIIPGLGLIYVGKKVLGIIFILLAIFGFLLCLTGILVIIGLPMFIFAELIGGIATVWFVIKYPGGWKWF